MDGWQLKIEDGLQAHFKQPIGPSRPAILWTVAANNGSIEKKLFVRDYRDDAGGWTEEQSAKATLEFIAGLIRGGWSPIDCKNEPGELIVPPRD